MATFRRNYRKTYRKRRSAPYKKRMYRKSGVKVSTVKSIVKKAIAANVENKTDQFFSPTSNIYVSTSGSFVSSIIPCSPYTGYLSILQSGAQGGRIGNRIKIKNLAIKGTIFPTQYNGTTNLIPQPVQVILWFFYKRDNPRTIPTTMTGFLQDGDTARDLDNNLTDVWSRVNGDVYRLLTKRVFKLGYSNYTTSSAGVQAGSNSFTNNDFKLNCNFKVNLTKYAVKNVKFNDSTTQPFTRGIYCLPQVVAASGGQLPSSQIMAQMAYELSISYEDA